MMQLDILAIGAHPDDVELGCGGIISKHTKMGYKVGILDLTQGELGTRGSVSTRKTEALQAQKILNVAVRENLKLKDGFFQNDEKTQLLLIQFLRKYQPKIIITGAPNDRHPDHAKTAQLTKDACFLSGLEKIKTTENKKQQAPWRPQSIYHYIQSYYLSPDIVVDITDEMDTKMKAIKAYTTQFFNEDVNTPDTFLTRPEFLKLVYGRATEFGLLAGYTYAEGLIAQRHIGVSNLFHLV